MVHFPNFPVQFSARANNAPQFTLGGDDASLAASFANGAQKLTDNELAANIESWLVNTLGKSTLNDADFVNLRDNYDDGFGTYNADEYKWQLKNPKPLTFMMRDKTITAKNYAQILANVIVTVNSDALIEGTFINTPAITEAGIKKYFAA
ncbi:MAG: hypothetical protein V4691_02785 [Pseudomonadota bacterium]